MWSFRYRCSEPSAEHLPLADAVFDAIVMTWTLCSIPNAIAALTEMRRVLRPGGRLIFGRARPLIGNQNCSLATLVDAILEADQRGLSSRPQGRRSDPRRWVPSRYCRNRLYDRTEALDIHVSRLGDEVGGLALGNTWRRALSLAAAFIRRCRRPTWKHHLGLNHHCGKLSVRAVY
jgi:SAM-dependent methyltransferase